MRIKIIVTTLIISLLVLVLPQIASAGHKKGTLNYLVGTGLLCGLDPSACPVISMAGNGDTLEVTGEGSIDLDAQAVTGGGNFVHKNPGGGVVAMGTWTAEELVSYHSWGMQDGLPPNFEGGRAKIKVLLHPSGTSSTFEATLEVFCTIGNFPGSAHEGVQLKVKHGLNFKDEVSGFTLFIRLSGASRLGGKVVTANMSGASEVPGPGDADGTGIALVSLDEQDGMVCFDISDTNITLPGTGAHIHSGAVGVAGPVVVALTAPDATGVSSGCILGVDTDLIDAIKKDPGNYYVNVHNADHPAGAVRGQLTK